MRMEQLGDDVRFEHHRTKGGSLLLVHEPTGLAVWQSPLDEQPVTSVRDKLLRKLHKMLREVPMLLEPWESFVDDEHRQAFERELHTELSRNHPLHGRAIRAVAHRSDCDDALFILKDDKYAVVHLTLSSSTEPGPEYPQTRLFGDLTLWAKGCMQVDHDEWKCGCSDSDDVMER